MGTGGGGGGPAATPKRPLPLDGNAGGDSTAKRPHTGLSGVTIYVPTSGLPGGSNVYAAWQRSVTALGGAVTQNAQLPGITHAVVPTPGASWAPLPAQLKSGSADGGRLRFVTQAWVQESIKRQQAQPEEPFAPPPQAAPGQAAAAAGSSAAARRPPPGGDAGGPGKESLRRWLGPLWRDECAEMDTTELMLQGDYDEQRCRDLGNEHVVQCLREMAKYEVALNGATLKDAAGRDVTNHKSLNYFQAAAAVRTCAYRLRPPIRTGQLPWVGETTAPEINQILTKGTCTKLERFRRDEPVRDSKGVLREDSAGAATRRRFVKLPGVGCKVAKDWWDRGLRTFEDVEAAAAGGRGGPLTLWRSHIFSVQHRAHLLASTTTADLAEMRASITAALEKCSGAGGWQLELVGGSRRQERPPPPGGVAADDDTPHHDADFIASHPTLKWGDNLLDSIRDELLARGRILPGDTGAMCSLQHGHLHKLRAKLLAEWTGKVQDDAALFGNLRADPLDHLFVVYRASGGALRRMDLILAPPEQLPYAVIGWIGSTMYNRFLRRHVRRCGMHMSSHGLYRVIDGAMRQVPEEAPPLGRAGAPYWPPGWGPGSSSDGGGGGASGGGGRWRGVRSQRDVFEVLRLPYREPFQRDLP